MIKLYNRNLTALLKIYVAIALLVALVLSPLSFSFAPVLLLAWYLFQWRRHISPFVNLMTQYFMFFAIALLFTLPTGPFLGVVISLPVLVLINRALEEYAEAVTIRDSRFARTHTSICLVIFSIASAVLAVAVMLNSLALILTDVVVIVYFVAIGIYALRHFPVKPVQETQVQQRIVAGKEEHIHIKLNSKTKVGGLLFVKSPYDWLKVSPNVLSLKKDNLVLKISLAPTLSGPSVIKLQVYAIDRWGLIQARFEMEPIKLVVIPRARYAAWLAKKYMSGTNPGILTLISKLESINPLHGLRRGVEYYGNRLYQPGDNLKNIDWKHSFKYNELITKEFRESHGQPAVILINLAAGDAEEADKLAYNIIVTATSLAQENIPAALAVYDSEEVILTTQELHAKELILRSLQVVKEITTYTNSMKYLNPPDVGRLRANLSRIRLAESHPAKVLTELLQLEYQSLSNNAKSNPCTKALSKVLTKVNKLYGVVIISHRNHDAEALAFNSFILSRRGNEIVSI